MQLAVIAGIFATMVGVAFAMQNNVPVTVNFLLWRFDSSLAMVLLLALALGAVIIALLSTPSTLKRQWQMTRQKRRIAELEVLCDGQRKRIADLENHIPAEPPSVDTPYEGFRELIFNLEHDPAKARKLPPV